MNATGLPRVIVTRPALQAAAAVAQLQSRGLDAVALPLIEIAAVRDRAPLEAAWRGLAQRRLVVFVSANAVLHFFDARPEGMRWPDALLAAAPGPGTTSALSAQGIDESLIVEPAVDAPQLDSEALWQRLEGRDWHGADVLVVRGDGGRDWLARQLEAAGARVEAVAAYARVAPAIDGEALALLEAAGSDPLGHAWLFSSSQAIDHLEAAAVPHGWHEVPALATHPRIAARARQAGFVSVREVQPGLDAVVACIQSMRP